MNLTKDNTQFINTSLFPTAVVQPNSLGLPTTAQHKGKKKKEEGNTSRSSTDGNPMWLCFHVLLIHPILHRFTCTAPGIGQRRTLATAAIPTENMRHRTGGSTQGDGGTGRSKSHHEKHWGPLEGKVSMTSYRCQLVLHSRQKATSPQLL